MKWRHRVLPFLLVTTSLALPSTAYGGSNGPHQAAFPVNDVLENRFLEWEQPPNLNATHHLIFSSVSGLLQRWPNTYRRNGEPEGILFCFHRSCLPDPISTPTSLLPQGHSIVPATIPIGTILYHGRTDDHIPDGPEWLAFDFEHAYLFSSGPCYMVSLQAKRDLRLLYFDGSSAAKMKDGTMDSQDVVAWGELRPDKYISERERAKALCDWGMPLGLDGFVRMEFHFEVILCDILDGLEVITFLDLLPRNATKHVIYPYGPGGPPFPLPPPPKPPPGWRGSLQKFTVTFFQALVAGGWHDRAPGETRVHLDYAGLVTFYDPTLPSLVEARQEKDRIRHRLEGIASTDAERVLSELRSVLTRKRGSGSGVDWASIVRVVTERYADRLEYLRFLLSSDAAFKDAAEQAAAVRGQLLVMLVPYITTDDVPHRLPASLNTTWAVPVVRRCSTTQTSGIPVGMLTPQEVRIHAAVEGTLREICRRLVLVWTVFFDVEGKSKAKAAQAIEVGRGHMDELMGWLDWSVWLRCEPACEPGENCYLPSWPFLGKDDPYDMTPRCILPEDIHN